VRQLPASKDVSMERDEILRIHCQATTGEAIANPRGPGSIPGATRLSEKWVWNGATQPREYN
jgi:hypothetical protein